MVASIFNKVPQGMRDLKPDKLPEGVSERWSKTPRTNEGGTVNEAGTPHPSGVGGCQTFSAKRARTDPPVSM